MEPRGGHLVRREGFSRSEQYGRRCSAAPDAVFTVRMLMAEQCAAMTKRSRRGCSNGRLDIALNVWQSMMVISRISGNGDGKHDNNKCGLGWPR